MAEPSKASGQYNSVMGNAKEAIGGVIESVTGSNEPSSWTTAGKQQHAQGEAEIKEAQVKQYGEGLSDRIEGKYDAVVGAATGDRAQELKGNVQHDKGKLDMKSA